MTTVCLVGQALKTTASHGWGEEPGPLLSADFDNDGDVDGNDFLAWQRNPGVGNLVDWQSEFGSGTATLVPEPSTWMLLSVGLFLLSNQRNRVENLLPS